MRILRIFAGLFICVFSLEFASTGAAWVWPWLNAHLRGLFYVHDGYAGPGLFYAVGGVIAFVVAAYVVLRRRASALWLLLAFIIFVVQAISLPSVAPPSFHVNWAQGHVIHTARKIEGSLVTWGAERGHLPASEVELAEAVKPAIGKPEEGLSRYVQRGKRLEYRVIYAGNATGPYLREPAGPEPALIYCAVSPDLKQGWLTATVLTRPAADRAIYLVDPDSGRPWTVHLALPAPPPPPRGNQ
jgi:hypothetical protein